MSDATTHDQYLVGHGKCGAVGVFTAETPLPLRRGARVLIETTRGAEVGEVLGPASLRQARLLGTVSAGKLLRSLTPEDEARQSDRRAVEKAIFEAARAWAGREGLLLEVLDVELLYHGQLAILQFVGQDAETEKFAQALEAHFGLTIRLENLTLPAAPEEEHHHCDKPDCGRESGGCTTCSTGGGCSSCGSEKVDLRPYFSHLRDQMETSKRIPLA
jgi:hypothetical protein